MNNYTKDAGGRTTEFEKTTKELIGNWLKSIAIKLESNPDLVVTITFSNKKELKHDSST